MRNKITPVEYNIIKKASLLYHQNLVTNIDRVNEVKEIFGINEDSIKIFKIGYCDGKNKNIFPNNKEIVNRIKQTDFIDDKRNEIFESCITIPFYNEKEQLTEILGLPLKKGKIKKRYIKIVKENSFLNYNCLKIYKEIFITYNIPLFFEAIQNNVKNIVPIITNFISDNQIRILRENIVEKIYFTFECNDQAVLTKLKKTNLSLYNSPVESFIDKNIDEVFENAVLIYSENVESVIEKKSGIKVEKINNGYEIKYPEREYKILGVKDDIKSSLRVVIKIKQGKENIIDTIDLYSSRARKQIIKEINQKLNLDESENEKIEKEFVEITEYIEKDIERNLQNKDNKKAEYILSEEEKQIGMKFLKSKDIFGQIDNDMTNLGYVGERINKIICYLVATSRKMDSPLASIIISRSAAGKSKLVETIEKLMPFEDVISMTASTDQAFYYMTDGMLKNKLVTIAEQEGKATADYPIRELLSRKSLSKAIPVRNRDGDTKTEFIKSEGPISYIETTTNFNVHPENASRCFQMYIDESDEQTKRVQELQKYKKTKKYFLSHQNTEEIVKRHHSAQRLLKPVIIFNPFVEHIKFPVNKLRTRRDHEKFLNLIEVITFIFQYQRPKKKLKINDKEIEYIDSTIEDYKKAYQLLTEGILQNTLDDLLKSSKDLLSLIINMVDNISIKESRSKEEITFSRRQIMEYTNWAFTQVRNHIKNLVDFELIETVKGKNNGQKHEYRLNLAVNHKDNIYSSLIPSPKDIENQQNNLTNLSKPDQIQVSPQN